MKYIAVILLILSGSAFAQIEFEETKIDFTSLLSVHQLRCVIPASNRHTPKEDRIFTRLNRSFGAGTVISHPEILFDHKEFTNQGCQLEVLDQIVTDAGMRFGHVEAKITVVKGLAKKPRIVFGKCQRNYQEEVFADLGSGIVLSTSKKGKLLPAVGCR